MKKLFRNLFVLGMSFSVCGLSGCAGSVIGDVIGGIGDFDLGDVKDLDISLLNKSNDDDLSFDVKNLDFENLSSDYYDLKNPTFELYFLEDGTVPYLDVVETIKEMDGFFDLDSIKYQFDADKNYLKLSYLHNNEESLPLEIHWDTNEMKMSDMSVFDYIRKSSNDVKDPRFRSYIKSYNHPGTENTKSDSITFDFGKYGFDIYYYQRKCLLPLFAFNLVFCSSSIFNLYYNGDKVYGYLGEMKSGDVYDRIYTSSKNGTKANKDMRIATTNGLLFALDYYYGLKGDYSFADKLKTDNKKDLEMILSTNTNKNRKGLVNILCRLLDDGHTRIDSQSMFMKKNEDFGKYDTGSKVANMSKTAWSLISKREKRHGDYDSPSLRFINDKAIISFDSFDLGSLDDVYDSEGEVKDDAWKYDTYFFFRKCMKDIENHGNIKDILIDLSLNGVGNLFTERRTIGFLTDNPICFDIKNNMTNEYSLIDFVVDTDGDGNFENDAYDQYQWTVLTSECTYSAANLMACQIQYQGLGKIIGQKSGGGTCAVLPTVMVDGTAIAMSNAGYYMVHQVSGKQNMYENLEDGAPIDVEIPYSDFYNDAKLCDYINQAWNK